MGKEKDLKVLRILAEKNLLPANFLVVKWKSLDYNVEHISEIVLC